MLAVQLLDLRLADIPSLVNLQEYVLDYPGLHRAAGTAEGIEIYLEPAVDVTVDRVIAVAELTRLHAFLERPGLTRCPVLVGPANIEGLIPFGTAKAGETIGRQDLHKISQVGNVVHVGKR